MGFCFDGRQKTTLTPLFLGATINLMRIEFDPAKSKKNERERGLSFIEAEYFDFDSAVRVEDLRQDYGETRILAYGFIGLRLHVLCYKPINKNHIRVISLRKANKREEKIYAKEIQTLD